jgi:hypothetical protein
MALTHTIARGVLKGLFTSGAPFLRTPKAEDRPALLQGVLMAREELVMLGLLWTAALAMLAGFGPQHREAMLWALILGVQALPYVGALYLSMANVFAAGARVAQARVAQPSATSAGSVLESPAQALQRNG